MPLTAPAEVLQKAAKAQAKSYARTKNFVGKFEMMRTQLRTLSHNMTVSDCGRSAGLQTLPCVACVNVPQLLLRPFA